MGVWTSLSALFGGKSSSSHPADGLSGSSTAVVDAPEDTLLTDQDVAAGGEAIQTEESDCWYRPAGERVLQVPRISRPSIQDQVAQADELLQALEEAMHLQEAELPRLPRIPEQVLLILAHDTTGMEEAARLISKDQALSADVLRRANCAAMVTVNQAGTLNEALTRLGVRGIRSTMIRQSMQSITLAIQDRQSVAHQLWRASRASACCTAIFAECFNVEFEDAYLAGLLHDLGQILILKMQSDIERSAQTKIPDVVYRFLCQEHHEAIGFRLAAQWCLPEEVTELVATHHSPLVSEDPRQNQRAVIQLVDATLSLLKYKPYVPFSLLTMPAAIHLKAADNPQFTSMLDTLPETISQMLASD